VFRRVSSAGRSCPRLSPKLLKATAVGGASATLLAAHASSSSVCDGDDKKMLYRMLGNTGLQVSVLSYGFWATFGSKSDLSEQAGVDMAKKCLRVARDAGVNLFDNAEVYGEKRGDAERIMGLALQQLTEEDPEKWRRSDLIITTKIFWGGDGVNEKGLSRKHIMEGLEESLKRLQVTYVDLVFCHRPDPFTPTETVVRAMTDMVRSGKATAWGTSEWSAQQITEAVWIAKTHGLEPPQFEQPQYHMFHRERFEVEYAPIYQQPYNIGTTIWSPLASGLLTGKYNNSIPKGSRLEMKGYSWLQDRLQEWHKDGKIEKVRKLSDYATNNFKCSVGQLALAWCLKNENVSTVLLGATKPEQLDENLKAIEIAKKMSKTDMENISMILGNDPVPYSGYGGSGMRSIDTL